MAEAEGEALEADANRRMIGIITRPAGGASWSSSV